MALIITAGMAVYLNLQLKKQEKQSSAGKVANGPTQKPETSLRPVRPDRFSMLAKQAVSAHDLGILRCNKGE